MAGAMMENGGGGSSHANPLPLNVVPLIDVIFCLLLFFMCSFHFKRLEGRMEAWLPRDKGPNDSRIVAPVLEEIRVVLSVDPATGRVVRKLGRNDLPDDAALRATMREQFDRIRAMTGAAPPLVLKSEGDVAWGEVFRVMDLATEAKLPRIEFALSDVERTIPGNPPTPK